MTNKTIPERGKDLNEVKKFFVKLDDSELDDDVCQACNGSETDDVLIGIPTSSFYANIKSYAVFHRSCLIHGLFKHLKGIELSDEMVDKLVAQEI